MINDLKFSGTSPVIINYNGSSEELYAPVRSSSCDINIVSKNILEDMYSSKKDDICVSIDKDIYGHETEIIQHEGWVEKKVRRVYDRTVHVWEGYMMPNTFSQDITQNLDNISMTVIDPVSMMKYVKIDKMFKRPSICSYRTIIGKCIGYVMIESNVLYVERNFSYGGDYDGTNGLMNMKCNISNFWDEEGDSSSAYDMINDMLKPFSLCLEFTGQNYVIFDTNKQSGQDRIFDSYLISGDGNLTYLKAETMIGEMGVYEFGRDWQSRNTSTSMSINSVYDRITATASTIKPEWSSMVKDKVSYYNTDKYDIAYLNVQTNKTNGYVLSRTPSRYELDMNDHWFYLWNGVYADEDYELTTLHNVSGWSNINKALQYYNDNQGFPDDFGSILNFYGGTLNPNGSGKHQDREKSVEIDSIITAYAQDNGIPPEFLEKTDLLWKYRSNFDIQTGTEELTKPDKDDAKYGVSKPMGESNRTVYHQLYDNINLQEGQNNQKILEINLSQSYSRTGTNTPIEIMKTSFADNRQFFINYFDERGYANMFLDTADVYSYPELWASENVVVDLPWFNRYARQERCSEVWDKRRIDAYVILSDGRILQFNGKNWVETDEPSADNCFWLKKLLNYENLYHNEMKYDLIECADGDVYALNNEGFTYWKDENGGVMPKDETGKTAMHFTYYLDADNQWTKTVESSDNGSLQIILPPVNSLNSNVILDIHNSTILGMTGADRIETSGDKKNKFHYEISGQARYVDEQGQTRTTVITESMCDANRGYGYKSVHPESCDLTFIPMSAVYVKAEHLDLDCNITVAESNLSHMFRESDIKYVMDKHSDFLATYEDITFNVNTYHPLVSQSFSYLIFADDLADPNEFRFGDINERPECYVVQAYMNLMNKKRKIYVKTLQPVDNGNFRFNNICTYITSPEIGDGTLVVVSDSWDIKDNRHTVEAIEDYDLNVIDIDNFDVKEIPRSARNVLYNLQSVVK